jgi:hypothetical protein
VKLTTDIGEPDSAVRHAMPRIGRVDEALCLAPREALRERELILRRAGSREEARRKLLVLIVRVEDDALELFDAVPVAGLALGDVEPSMIPVGALEALYRLVVVTGLG